MSRLFIGNLPNESREDDVRRVFGEKAQIRELILKNGYAFIEYNDADTADLIRRDLDGADFGGKSMRIDRAKPKPSDRDGGGDRRRDGGGYGDRGGYQGGRGGGYGDRYDRGAPPAPYGDRYDDRRGPTPPPYGDRYDDRRGGYEDRRGGYEDRRGGQGGYDRPRYDRPRFDRPPRDSRHAPPHSSEFGLTVDGLPPGIDWKEIKDHFRPMGSVCYVTFKNGQGVVQFENEEGLQNALKSADGSSIRGSVITVTRVSSSGSSGAAPSSDAGLQRSPSPRQADSPGAN